MNTIEMEQARNILAKIWGIAGGTMLLFVVIISFIGNPHFKTGEILSWFMPTIMPTIFTMVGVYLSYTTERANSKKKIPHGTFIVTVGLSVFYLLLLLITIIGIQFKREDPSNVLIISNMVLTIFQGVVVAAIAVFFSRPEKEEAKV